ncbi:MAG: TolC family protein [Terracidiphilus sp.]
MRDGHNRQTGWRWTLIASAALLVPVRFCAAQIPLSTVVNLAERNSDAVRIAEAGVFKAQAALRETKDAYAPSITLGSGLPALPDVGFTGGVPSIVTANVQSTVFSLPQNQYVAAARSGLKAASLALKNAREQVALEVSTAYLELDTVNSEQQAALQQEGFAERLVIIEQERAEAGVDPLSDLLQARLSEAELRLKQLHLETRAGTLASQIAALTGLPAGSIAPDHGSIPEIPKVRANEQAGSFPGIESAETLAVSKRKIAHGDLLNTFVPQIGFNAFYVRNTTILNDFNAYYAKPIPVNNFSSGFTIQIPLFDLGLGAKARESAADALKATVEAEEARKQNDVRIAQLTGSLREMDTLEEIASLKQQIAAEQLKTVVAQLELGNGQAGSPGAAPQLSPKTEQLARIDERQKYQDALEAKFDLAKARLNLLCALGHIEDWLNELHAP